jgi:translation initiation factor 3 subunit I
VTTTSAKAGGFEARFYHKIYAEEFGNVSGSAGLQASAAGLQRGPCMCDA